jgi:acyl carrier protein
VTTLRPLDVRGFLLERFLSAIVAIGMKPEELGDDFDLIKSGVVDSLGVIEMISAVELQFKIIVDFEPMDPELLALLGPFSRFVAEHAVKDTEA